MLQHHIPTMKIPYENLSAVTPISNFFTPEAGFFFNHKGNGAYFLDDNIITNSFWR